MDPDKILNAVVDLVNGEIDNNAASEIVRKELDTTSEYSDGEKSKIVEMVDNFTSAGDLPDFVEEISSMLSGSEALAEYVSRNND